MVAVVVAGATGAIGREVVIEAVADPRVHRVVALSRRSIDAATWSQVFGSRLNIDAAQKKLAVVGVDWERLTDEREAYLSANPTVAEGLSGATIGAMCMGTTKKDAGSAKAFRRCDLEYVQAFGKSMQQLSGSTLRCFSQISSQGANSNSWFLYMKTKGEADDATIALQFPHTSIFRPGLLERGDKARTVESFFGCFVTGMPVTNVAKALLRDALAALENPGSQPKVEVHNNASINRLASL